MPMEYTRPPLPRPVNIEDTKKSCASRSVVAYVCGATVPHYPVPAIDYYNSPNPDHFIIGHLMEWIIPLDIQTKFRCID